MPPPSRVLHPRLFHAPACEQKRCHETDDEEVATKKKVLKQQRFLKAYNEKWNCLVRSTKGDTYVFCTLCHADFSCAHGGRSDCAKHISSKSHDNLEKLSKGTPSIMMAFSAQTSKSAGDLSLQITNAEAMMCRLVADANLSLSMADRLVPMFKEMFPDSKIAQGMQCGRTKATIMIKEMSALAMKNLADQMKMRPFSIATDGSNEWYRKQFPLVIRTFSKDADGKLEKVTTQLLALRDCEGSATGENIFRLVDGELKAQGVPWTNCVAFGSDNAAVMTGQHKGVFSFVLKKNSKVYLAACTLHLVHIGAKKGAACLPPIEEILLDIYYFFRKSTLRQSNLMELQELYDVTQRKMLKHGCTRWLSIARCIKRLLENWEPLKQLFHEEYKKRLKKKKRRKVTRRVQQLRTAIH